MHVNKKRVLKLTITVITGEVSSSATIELNNWLDIDVPDSDLIESGLIDLWDIHRWEVDLYCNTPLIGQNIIPPAYHQPKASDAIFISYKTVMFTTRCFNVIHSTLLLLRHASGEFIFYVVHAIPLKENGKGVLKSEMCSIFIQDEQKRWLGILTLFDKVHFYFLSLLST